MRTSEKNKDIDVKMGIIWDLQHQPSSKVQIYINIFEIICQYSLNNGQVKERKPEPSKV